MAPQHKTSAPARRETDGPLHELGRDMVASADMAEPAADHDAGAEIGLALSDLLRDADGEVVVYNDSGFRTLAIATDAAVVASGRSGPHVTEAGADVSGFSYVTFDDGTTLYYQDGLDLRTRPLTD